MMEVCDQRRKTRNRKGGRGGGRSVDEDGDDGDDDENAIGRGEPLLNNTRRERNLGKE